MTDDRTATDPASQPDRVDDDGSTAVDLTGAIGLLDDARTVTVLCHVQPDADTIGSGLALGMALRRRGHDVQVSFAEPATVPESMRDLPGTDLIVAAEDVRRSVDLLVTVDCGTSGRLGSLSDRLPGAASSLVIDHHRSNTRFGTHNLIDDAAESTTAVLADLFDRWGVEIDRDLASCLYAGLATDTGSFRWVRAGTHELAERLLATGIDGARIVRRLLDTHPFGWLPMLSAVLGSAQLVPDAVGGRGLVHAAVRLRDSEGLRSEEIESVIDIVRTTAEAEVAAVFKETAPDEWAVSLRSKADVDVSVVASALGGGGHRFSSGYTATGTRDQLVTALVDALG